MRRRDAFSVVLGVAAWPLLARAQSTAMPVVGYLHSASPDPKSSYTPATEAFRKGLAETGYVEGRDVAMEYRWAQDHFERLPQLAHELVQKNVSLIFAGGGDVTALAAKNATAAIPIVFAIGADPVKQHIVASLSRPGGNVTGVTFLSVEVRPKMLELMRDLVPRAATIAVLGNANRPNFEALLKEVVDPARKFGLTVRVAKAGSAADIDAAFKDFASQPVDALLVLSDPVYLNQRHQLARLTEQQHIPAVFSSREHVTVGGLASYGASLEDSYYQAGKYAGHILKGEKPADLPVLQPTKFDLTINLKTAKALGITVPLQIQQLADDVIE